MSARLLVISNKAPVSLQSAARAGGFNVEYSQAAAGAMERALQMRPDLMIVDCRINEAHGLQLCRSLRSLGETSAIPLMTVAGPGQDQAQMNALEAGADDCLFEPISTRDLELRFAAIRRRYQTAAKTETLSYADLELDLQAFKVRRNGMLIRLTMMQMRLLKHLMENPTIVFSRQQLLQQVWGDPQVDEGAVTASVVRLRRALNAAGPNLIRSVQNIGYSLDVECE